MPQVYFRDNYCYEISGNSFSVLKYDILSNDYYKIEQCYLHTLPTKYSYILKDIKEASSVPQPFLDTILQQLTDIKVR